MPARPSPADASEAQELLSHVRERAASWFPDLPAIRSVRVVDALTGRTRSRHYRIRVGDGEEHRDVVAKVTSLRTETDLADASASTARRPRLGSLDDYEAKHALEYETLRAVYERMAAAGDRRLRAVRPLDHLPDRRTLFLEHVDQPTLRPLAYAALRRGAQGRDIAQVCNATGAWLARYHATPPPAGHGGARRPRREDVLAALTQYLRFLADATHDHRFFTALERTTVARAERVLPPELPLGLGHGDCAPRNTFVYPDGGVAMFDVLGRWHVPVYEDLAYFRLALRLSGPQALLQDAPFDPRRIAACEHAFVAGYDEDGGISAAVLTVFEQLVLFDRWSAEITRATPRTPRGAARRAARVLVTRSYRREAGRLAEVSA